MQAQHSVSSTNSSRNKAALMNITGDNLTDLVWRFFEQTPARGAAEVLERSRKWRLLRALEPILRRRLRNAAEQLSRFYGLVEIGFVSGFISTEELPVNLRVKWLVDLSDPILGGYIKEQGLLLPI